MTRMTHVPAAPLNAVGEPRFDGAVASALLAASSDGAPSIALVNFDAGAHTAWHTHAGPQYIFVIEGAMQVRTADDAVTNARDGDLVMCPAGVQHWHGADGGESCRTFVMTWGETTWGDMPG